MSELLPEPRTLAAIAIAVICIELLVVIVVALRGRLALDAVSLVCNLVAGLSLLLAMYAALSGAGAAWVAVGLGLALVAHVGDIGRRLRPRASAVATARGGLR